MALTIDQTLRQAVESGETVSFLDARLLLMQVLNCSLEQLIADPGRKLTVEETRDFQVLVARRAQGEPVSQILQHKEFWGLSFRVTSDVLTPRPDSETLIELTLDIFRKHKPGKILDIGTGSGCLLAALLSEFPEAEGVAVDISEAALAIAGENFRALELQDRITLKQADFNEPIAGTYDLVISNPPYIAETDRENLPVDVRIYEPAAALFAGDGYSAYRAITRQLPALLVPSGVAILELGQGQAQGVSSLIETAFPGTHHHIRTVFRDDLAGICRAVAVIAGEKRV